MRICLAVADTLCVTPRNRKMATIKNRITVAGDTGRVTSPTAMFLIRNGLPNRSASGAWADARLERAENEKAFSRRWIMFRSS